MPYYFDDWAICGLHEVDAEVGARRRILLAPHPRAFGFGEHPSTRECLQLLRRHQVQLPGWRVVDVGTGTGILAIAAVLLGASEVVAFEQDEEIRALAAQNFALNEVDIELRGSWPEDWDGHTFDLALANIDAGPLSHLVASQAVGNGKTT